MSFLKTDENWSRIFITVKKLRVIDESSNYTVIKRNQLPLREQHSKKNKEKFIFLLKINTIILSLK